MFRRSFILAGAVLALATLPSPAHAAPRSFVVASAGYNGGPGGYLGFTLRDFAEGMPMGLRFGVGYSGADPGDPWAARRVFINDNANGTPESNGRRWDYRLDGVWRTHRGPFDRLDIVAGPRLSRFSAQFDFVGGNEYFNVVTTQWGLGLGGEASFRMSDRADFVAGTGLDYFFNAKLSGHDTSYSPDGSALNRTGDYTWADADAAIHQPKLTPRLMFGVQYRLGR
jgi:hypothetical protein